MKQTSQAIVLLISSANAAALPITTNYQSGSAVWQPQVNVNAASVAGLQTGLTNQGLLQSRTAPYKTQNMGTWSWAATVYNLGKLAATYDSTVSANAAKSIQVDATTTTGASSCMSCIGKGNVWCSRTWSFNIKSVNTYQQDATTYQTSMLSAAVVASTDALSWTASTAVDQGSCCNSAAAFVLTVGTTATAAAFTTYVVGSTPGAAASSTSGSANVGVACVAFKNTATTGGNWGINSYEVGTTAFTSWWCSNGLYKNVTKSANSPTVSYNTIQILGTGDNARQELAFVGCPQIQSRCGGDATGLTSLTSTTAVKIEMPKTMVLVYTDKCTWTATAWDYAPTFKLTNGNASVAADNLGINKDNWIIHHMEYITSAATNTAFAPANGLLVSQAAVSSGDYTGIQDPKVALGYGNFVPKFTMSADQFSTLRTWYGDGLGLTNNIVSTSVYGGQSLQWFANSNNGSVATAAASLNFVNMNNTQQFGNVSNIPYSSITDVATAGVVPAGQNYGNNGTSIFFDFRTVRYMPASAAQTVWTAGNTLNTAYTSQTTSYATAKTTWNAYVAILKKNAKMDAFAAAFSPPKAPTVPPLPNMPWTPSAYSGFLKQTPEQYTAMIGNVAGTSKYVTAAQPTAQQFWTSLDAAQTIGGWGVFTASIVKFRNGWGKSFGTIGYGPGTQSMSQIWSYKQMCGSANVALGVGPTYACDKAYTVTANTVTVTASPTPTTNGSASATAWMFVTSISLWSKGDTNSATITTNAWTTYQSMAVEWTAAPWGNALQALGAISPPTAPTAADSLTGVAGASALAASSAAVLAIAALY